jgi:hypothetical protein
VLLAACRPDQTAKEVSLDGVPRGAFSVALERALGGVAGPARYDDVHRLVAAAVRNLAADQSPVLETPSGEDARRPFLGGVAAPAVPVHTAAWVAGRGWVLDAGRVHGLALGSPARPAEVLLFPVAGGEALATARVASVGATTSLLQVADPLALDEGSVYRAEVVRNGQPGVAVVVTGEPAGVVAAVRERLGRSAVVHVAEAGELEVRCELGAIRALRVGLDEEVWATGTVGAGDVGPAVGGGVVERVAVERVAAVCEHVGRWLGVATRANPTSRLEADAVELAVLDVAGAPLPSPDGSVEVWYSGPGESDRPLVRIRCANRSLVPLHCAVLVLGDDYGIGCLTVGGSVLLRPGESAFVTDEEDRPQVRAFVPPGRVETTDLLVLVASTEPFDGRGWEQDDLAAVISAWGSGGGGGGGADGEGTDGAAGAGTRAPASPLPDEGPDWTTRQVLLRTRRLPGQL